MGIAFFYFIKSLSGLVTKGAVRDSVLIVIFSTIITFLVVRPDLTPELTFLQKFFNIAYPLGDIILASGALIMLRISTGKARSGVLILVLALLIHTIADFTFTFQAARGTYWNGNIADLFYTVSAFIFGIALIQISSSGTGEPETKT